MTEETKKAFEKWREKTIRESYHGGMSTCSPHILANFRGAEGARMAFEHQQKRINDLEKALSALCELDESDVWTADAWDECFNLARKTLKEQNND